MASIEKNSQIRPVRKDRPVRGIREKKARRTDTEFNVGLKFGGLGESVDS
jgi:hypothetical protein